ncbi:hypothetical protein ID866_4814 [Astraeus odoratus]|nr:hypothetical protein ID866_4814 [Astraeus odoratus]
MLSAVAARKKSKPAGLPQEQSPGRPLSPPPISANASREWSPSRPIEEPTEPTAVSNFSPTINQNTFVPSKDYLSSLGLQDERAVVLIVNAGESLALLGPYLLTVLQGCVSLCGVTLSASLVQHRVFAPRSSPVPVISWTPLRDLSDSTQLPLPSGVNANTDSAVLLIQYLGTGIEELGLHKVLKFPRYTSYVLVDLCSCISLTSLPHEVSHSTKDILPFRLPPSWDVALSSMDPLPDAEVDAGAAPLCIVKGPKKSGKSTFSRTLVNRLLKRYRRVAFLECDVGQSEFTPGGMVALNIVENYVFGPPFTHPSLPYRAHFVGSTSPRTSPSYYLAAVQSLLETYRLEVHIPVLPNTSASNDNRIEDVIPLVVNTMGWTKGLGADLNARIEESAEASHIFEIEGSEEWGWPAPTPSQPSNHCDPLAQFGSIKDIVHMKIEAIPTAATTMHAFTAVDQRHINILSYFHAVFPPISVDNSSALISFSSAPSLIPLAQFTAERWDVTLPLCARYPYDVACDSAFDRVYLVGAGYEDVRPSELIHVLNGAIVGLMACDPSAIETEGGLSDDDAPSATSVPAVRALPYTPGQAPPCPSSSNCLGVALVRGVSPPSTSSPMHLHVLTPLHPSLLSHTRILIKGELELPIWGMLDFRVDDQDGVAGLAKGQVPYLQWGKGEGLGSERRRIRRNLMRKSQM